MTDETSKPAPPGQPGGGKHSTPTKALPQRADVARAAVPPKSLKSGIPSTPAGAAAGTTAEAAVTSKLQGPAGQVAGRYAGAAASGAADGAIAGAPAGGVGAAPGAAAGAAKGAATQAATDVGELTAKRLGAGGTSLLKDASKHTKGDSSDAGSFGDSTEEAARRRRRTGVAVGAAAATPPAAFALSLLLFLNWLKSLLFAVAAQLANLLQLVMQWLALAGKTIMGAITKPFMSAGAAGAKAVAAVTGGAVVSTTVAAASIATVSGFSILALLASLFGVFGAQFALFDTPAAAATCRVVASSGAGGSVEAPGTQNANTEKNAQSIYSVLKTWGMPEENIAGILGNWEHESGIDPTSVQHNFASPHAISPAKQSEATNTDNGIGLGQWTFGRNAKLREYAQSKGADWWQLGTQLTYMAEGDNPGSVDIFKDMLTTSRGTPAAAAIHFHDVWEVSADGPEGIANRGKKADAWFAKMSGWTVNKTEVSALVGSFVVGGATTVGSLPKPKGCDDEKLAPGAISLKNGGMTQAEAQALVDLYNIEGDKFLDGRYGEEGGPGSCNGNHALNCVSFSTYFVNKYTQFQTYPMGDGIKTAYSVAAGLGKQMSSTPTPYSVGSGPGSSSAGHTLVVLGVQGDQVVLAEAGWCQFMGRVRVDSAAAMAAEGWMFVDVSDVMLPPDQVKTS